MLFDRVIHKGNARDNEAGAAAGARRIVVDTTLVKARSSPIPSGPIGAMAKRFLMLTLPMESGVNKMFSELMLALRYQVLIPQV